MDSKSLRFLTCAWRALAGIALLVQFPGCQTPRNVSTQPGDGFVVGGVYSLLTPMRAVKWGNEVYLIEELKPTGNKRPAATYWLPKGTEIEVLELRSENTLTHGREHRVVGAEVTSRYCPSRMTLPPFKSGSSVFKRVR